MEPRAGPVLPLLLACLWPSSSVQTLYILDSTLLTLHPASTVQSGTPVTLACEVLVSHDGSFNLTFHFQFTRDDVLLHSSSSAGQKASLEISPSRAADSGVYECRVSVGDKSQRSPSRFLDVQGLQVPVLEVSRSRVYEGEEFSAVCSAPEERGRLIFQFYLRDSSSGDTRMLKQTGPAGSSSETRLVLRKTSDCSLFCHYEVVLVSGNRRSDRSNLAQVAVRGLYIAPVMNVLYPFPDIYEGDILEVVCKVVNPPKDVEVFLTRERRVLKRATVSLNHRFKAHEGDSGQLVCKAQWGNVQRETNMSITVKSLFSAPRLSVTPGAMFEGDTFTLACLVSVFVPERINNETMRFSIFRGQVRLTSSPTYISVAHPSQNGNYSCQVVAASLPPSPAQNFVKRSAATEVRARVPASEPALSVSGGTLVLGRPFQLLCRSARGTAPITYTLSGPDRAPQSQVVGTPGGGAVFNASALHESSDVGRLECRARNSQRAPEAVSSGHTLLSSTTIIEPVSEPVLTLLPADGDVAEGRDLTLTCSVSRGSAPFNFTWHRGQRPGALRVQVEQRRTASHTIAAVTREDAGDYYCTCTNPALQGRLSRTLQVSVKMADWKKAVVGVGCVLLVLVLVLGLVFRRGLRGLGRRRGELSVKPAGTKAERLSLTQAEVDQAANVTPGIMGKSVWSELTSGSESDEQVGESAPDRPRPQQPPSQSEANAGVLLQEQVEGSLEYAELNLDSARPAAEEP